MTTTSDELRMIMGSYPTGVVVVAGIAESGKVVGLAINSFTSLSLDPPLILFCPADSSRSWPQIAPSGRFSVSILAESGAEACTVFAGRSEDKFAQVDWHTGPGGLPALDNSIAVLACDITATYPGGDHNIVVGQVTALHHEEHARPLVYHKGAYAKISD